VLSLISPPEDAGNLSLSIDLSAYYNTLEIDSLLNAKEFLSSDGNNKTINVGRGDVYIENNIYDAPAGESGAGLTFRTSVNPLNGSILAVRSFGQVCRLWVGQGITTPGDNSFYCGYTGAVGDEEVTTYYKHRFDDTTAIIGTNLTVDNTLYCDRLNVFSPSTDIQITPTNTGIQIGKIINNMCISLCSPNLADAQFIDFTYTGVDFRGRVIYRGDTNKFQFYTGGSLAAELNTTAMYSNDFLALSDKSIKKI
jgi:hypothetical protein